MTKTTKITFDSDIVTDMTNLKWQCGISFKEYHFVDGAVHEKHLFSVIFTVLELFHVFPQISSFVVITTERVPTIFYFWLNIIRLAWCRLKAVIIVYIVRVKG